MDNNLERLRSIKTFPSLVKYLRDDLDWEFETEDVEDLTYDYSAAEFGLDVKSAAAIREIKQLRPIVEKQPWGIFYLDFKGQKVSVSVLRAILRGLVAKKRASQSEMRKWRVEDLLFICTSDNFTNFNFAYFRGAQTSRAVLSTFGWHHGDTHLRTLAEYNLPGLRFPSDTANTDEWLKKWRAAFDVEAVTSKFFADYHNAFLKVEAEVKRTVKSEDAARLFTQRLFNRLMFIYFIQKKGWLSFNGNRDYLRALFEVSETNNESFLRDRLYWLFFNGMSNAAESREVHALEILVERRGEVPYLNGGLFDMEDEWDESGKVNVSNSTFRSIIDLFERYNFTVEESTPLNIQVAVDPEMLGKVFEELVTGREARQDAGRYYTPRNIVSFMCRESLKKYLGGYANLIDERTVSDISVPEANDLLAMLDKLKVVDPACGSGAYLLGMLHELHALTNLLRTRSADVTARDDYSLKLSIIERNLYGVDKDNLAVQIARFRLWLSLIIEYDDKGGIHDLPTLPNLDFKIECGDSLTAPSPENVKSGSFRTELIAQYKKSKAEFLSAHGKDKSELRKEIKKLSDTIRHEAAFWLYGNVPFEGFDWAIEFAEVFDNGGFDVVLANPPYGATVRDNVRDLYFDRRTEGAQSKDTYGLFIARGLQLLREGGQLCFIVSDTWRTIKTHKPLRRRLVEKTNVWHVLDLPSWIFNATVNTGILTLTKLAATTGHRLIAGDLRGIRRGDWNTLTSNLLAVAAHGIDVQTLNYARYTYRQSIIATHENYSFFIGSPNLYALLSSRNDGKAVPLKDVAEVKVGLQTGDNRYHLRKRMQARGNYLPLDEKKLLTKNEVADLTENEKLNGVDPEKYGGRHFVPYDKGGESDAHGGWLPNYYVPTQYFIDWSAESVHRMKTRTSARQNGRIAARFQNSSYYFKEGITFSDTGFYAPTFRLSGNAVFDVMGMTIFTNEIPVPLLLAILVSRLIRYLIKNNINHTVHTQVDGLKPIPLWMGQDQRTALIESLVLQLIEKQQADQYYPYHLYEQRELELLIYQLYDLTDDDVREIELWYCRRYSRLAEAQGVMQQVHEKYADHLARANRILEKPPAYWLSHPILTRIGEEDEGQTFELKETLEVNAQGNQEPATALKTLKTVAAFLNTDGGTLLIGVSDDGNIRGLDADLQYCSNKNVDGFKLKLRDMLKSRLAPDPRDEVSIEIEYLPEGAICRVEVEPRSDITLVDNDFVYIRVGNRTERLNGPDKLKWAQKRGAAQALKSSRFGPSS